MPSIKLTQKRVDAAKRPKDLAGSSTFVYWDTETPGFGLRVSRDGTRSYVIKYRFGGRQRMRKFCNADQVKLKDAREGAKKRFGLLALGEDPFPPPPPPEEQPLTLEELCEDWIDRYAKVHRKNIKTPQSRVDYICADYGAVPARELTVAQVAAIHRKKGIEEGAKVSANRILSLLRTIYTWGQKQHLVPDGYNPAERVARFSEEARDRVLARENIGAFWRAVEAEAEIYPYLAGAVKLLLLTGARRGEILSARWDDFDPKARTLILRDTKNKTDHTLPLSPQAVAVIEDLEALRQADNPYLICGSVAGEPLKDIRKGWERILADAGIKDLTRHDLRRSFATHISGLGHDFAVVEWLLNHKLQGVAAVYNRLHAGSPAVRKAVEDYGAWIMRQVHGDADNIVPIEKKIGI